MRLEGNRCVLGGKTDGRPRDRFPLAAASQPGSPTSIIYPSSKLPPRLPPPLSPPLAHAPWLVDSVLPTALTFRSLLSLRSAIYAVYTSPAHPPLANHLPTLIVTPHGAQQQRPQTVATYLTTSLLRATSEHSVLLRPYQLRAHPLSQSACTAWPNSAHHVVLAQNAENYLLTPSPQGDLCVAKLFPPRGPNPQAGKASASDPGHGGASGARVVRCEASRNLKWTIANTGVISPIYKLSLPSPDSPDLPLFQISKPNPNAAFWSMFYFAYAGHNIPPRRIEFGKIQKNPPGPNGGGTRISITGKTPEEKAVWQTLGEGNEDCVEWVVLCAALNLLEYVTRLLDYP